MLLTIDLGNTSIKLGVFDEDKLVTFSCFDTKQKDYRSLFLSFLFKANLRTDDIDRAILSCVVPNLWNEVTTALQSIVGNKIIDINPNDDYGITFDLPNPDEVGDDIIVMSAYAYNMLHRDIIIVSIGTATAISHINKDGQYKHCIIAPGFDKMAQTLWGNAAQLPEFNLEKKDSFLANTTVDAMNVGIYNGYLGMLTYLVEGMKKEINSDPYIIACGGLCKKVVPYVNFFNAYDPDFVTKGLAFIAKKVNNE